MKMDKIKFRCRYNNDSTAEEGVWRGFDQFQLNGETHLERQVVVSGEHWDGGVATSFDILDIVSPCNGIWTIKYERKVVNRWYYDQDNQEHKELMGNLASNDLRGKLAERTAMSLFFRLFFWSEYMKEHLPQAVAFHREHSEKYGWAMTCGITRHGTFGPGFEPPEVKQMILDYNSIDAIVRRYYGQLDEINPLGSRLYAVPLENIADCLKEIKTKHPDANAQFSGANQLQVG